MEELDEYEYGFTRLRHILKEKYDDPSGKKPRPKFKRNMAGKKAEEGKQEEDMTTMASEKDKKSQADPNETEEPMIEEITDEQAEAIEKEEAAKKEAEKKDSSGDDDQIKEKKPEEGKDEVYRG